MGEAYNEGYMQHPQLVCRRLRWWSHLNDGSSKGAERGDESQVEHNHIGHLRRAQLTDAHLRRSREERLQGQQSQLQYHQPLLREKHHGGTTGNG